MIEPKISVIVPVYNSEKHLERCVNSIISQTYTNLEIILVDDGSTDSSPSLCDALLHKDNRVKVIHKNNGGAGFARNTGIEGATGEGIFFVDSDDYVDATAIEKCVLNMKETGADVVMFGRCNVSSNGTVIKWPVITEKYFFQGKSDIENILSGLFTYDRGFGISVWGKMFNLDIIRKNKIRFRSERELMSEDAYFLIELFSHISSASVLPENLYYYFENENSFSRTYKKEHQELADNFLTYSLNACEKIGYSERVSLHIKARYHIYSLAGMKQIVSSNTDTKHKKYALKEIFNNQLLRDSITKETLVLSKPLAKIFWRLYKFRCYSLCRLLLWHKTHK